MVDAERVTKLAEALADGQTPDWSSADQFADDDRELIAELRAVASIGHLFGTVSCRATALAASRARLVPGTTWGGLRVLEHVGAGRFGDVYRAWDPALAREIALKLIPRATSDDGSDSQVVEEGRLMARVHHPNVVSVFGAQRIGDVDGLWMEFVAGHTLAQELADRGPFDADDLVSIGAALCRALQAVHDAGLVHRDVKTQNVMRDAWGRVVLGDFGIGRELHDSEDSGGLAGTPAYIAPEIFEGRPATPQSDLYSVGALLFYLATRTYPVEGRSLRSLRDAHQKGVRTPLDAHRRDLPASVIHVIERALAAVPSERFERAEDMAAALERSRVALPARRWRSHGVMAAAVALTALTAAAFSMGGRSQVTPVPFEARDWVLVTAFDNRTEDSVPDGALEYALERELTNSPFVNVVPRARVIDTLQLMQSPPDTRVDATVGREVALRDGQIRAVIGGRIEKVGATYVMTAGVMQPTTGTIFASVSESSIRQGELLDAVGRLALRVRQRLGEALPQTTAPKSLPRVTTRSLRALQLYAKAVAMQNAEGTWGRQESAAVQLLSSAIEQDPEFASAHMLLSLALRLLEAPRPALVLHHAERAVALSGKASEVERLVNKAEWYAATALVKGTAYERSFTEREAAEINDLRQAAIASYKAVLALEPHHYQALISVSNLQRSADNPDTRISRQLADLRPHSVTWQMRAAQDLLAEDRRAEALPYLQRARGMAMLNPGAAFNVTGARLFDAYEAWMRGDAHAAKRIVDNAAADLDRLPSDAVPSVAAPLYRAYLALGQLDRAEHFAAKNSPNAVTIAAVFREDREALRAVLARNYQTVNEGTGVASAFVDAGLINHARARLAVLKRQSPNAPRTIGPPPASVLNYLALVEGQIAMAEGRADKAIAILVDFLRHQPVGTTGDRWILATHTLAQAWAHKGDVDRAIALLESVPWRIDLVMQSSNFNAEWLQARDHLAQWYWKAGRTRDADAVDSQLLRLLAVADAEPSDSTPRHRASRGACDGASTGPRVPGSSSW